MKRLNKFALCALLVPAVTLGTSAAFAQTQQRTTPDSAQQERMDQDRSRTQAGQAQQQRHLSSKPASAFYSGKLMGADVRSRQDNEDIGTINELVIDNDGKIVAVIVGVGGFLGMGDREVAISWDSIDVETDPDGDTRFFVDQSREQLKNIPEYSRDGDARRGTATTGRTGTTSQNRDAQERQQQTAVATGTTTQQRMAQQHSEQDRSDKKDADKRYSADKKSADKQSATMGSTQRTTGMSQHAQLSTKPANAFHGDKLLSAELRSRPEETKIGSIDELVIDNDGQIVAVIVSVGGFLGMGQRDVAISWDSIQAETDAEGDTRFFVNMTEEQLKNAPKFNRD
ncbi:MAG: PRC-barrel domain-containing protein [Gammaproteobacteria bacterium]